MGTRIERLRRRPEAQAWYAALRATSNERFLPLYFDEHRYLVLCGGGGSGKSIFAGRKILERVTTEPGHRWLVCRKVARTLRDSCFAQLVGQLRAHYPRENVQVSRAELRLSFPNGSEILFAGLDDPEKLKSIFDITGIWVEEASEITEADFNQLDIRLRTRFAYPLQMILSFNPVSVTHWLKKRFFDSPDPRATTHRSTYRDNRFLPPEAVRTLEAFRDADPYYYQVYCLGEWGVTGRTVFDANAIAERLRSLPAPVMQGFWEWDGEAPTAEGEGPPGLWRGETGGPVTIYRAPEPGRPYVLGGDTAGDGSDWFVAQVLDNVTGEQVAVLRHRYDEDTYARQVFCLGRYYNDALTGIEVNASTYPVKLLDRMGYRRLYVREAEDSYTGETKRAFGFCTTALTRPVIVSELIRVLRGAGTATLADRTTLEELLTFVRNDRLRPEAAPGAHDDCVMALAIAHYIRPQQRSSVRAEGTPSAAGWTEDMWQDYDAADPAERAYLRKIWGGGLAAP